MKCGIADTVRSNAFFSLAFPLMLESGQEVQVKETKGLGNQHVLAVFLPETLFFIIQMAWQEMPLIFTY